MLPDFMTKTAVTKSGKKVKYLQWWVTLLMALALAIGTWNPTGHHFIHYITTSGDIFSGFKPFAILLMIAMWLLAIKAIFQSLGYFGSLVVVIIILAFIWGLQQYNIIDVTKFKQAGWAATIAIALLIWIGLNASIIWKKLTGVYTTENIDEDI